MTCIHIKYIFLFVLSTLFSSVLADNRLVLGGNFNEHSEMIRWELLQESHTRVIRGFIPASPFINGQRDVGTAPAVQSLKKAVENGYKVILCLKWDFKVGSWRVPTEGSVEEIHCFRWVDDLLEEIGDVLALETINEVMVDTLEADTLPDASGKIAMVEFQKRLVDHLFTEASPPTIYMGGFTRLDREHMQTHPITLEMFEWINEDQRITGTNFHIHMPEMEGFTNYLDFIRKSIPEKPFIITEFSLVWKYKQAVKRPLGRFAKGKKFAHQYGLDPEILVRDYINSTIDNRVPEEEWNDFLRSQYWYEAHFLDQACQVMEAYGTRYATYAFQQGSSGRGKLGPNTNPWILNPIYVPSTAVGTGSKTAVNKDFYEAYGKWR
jgi:hypothetical protein